MQDSWVTGNNLFAIMWAIIAWTCFLKLLGSAEISHGFISNRNKHAFHWAPVVSVRRAIYWMSFSTCGQEFHLNYQDLKVDSGILMIFFIRSWKQISAPSQVVLSFGPCHTHHLSPSRAYLLTREVTSHPCRARVKVFTLVVQEDWGKSL